MLVPSDRTVWEGLGGGHVGGDMLLGVGSEVSKANITPFETLSLSLPPALPLSPYLLPHLSCIMPGGSDVSS